MRPALRRLAERLEPVPAAHREHPLRIGFAVLAAGTLALWFCLTHSLPFLTHQHGRLVRAEFASANQVDTRTPVRVGGVDVGKVDAIQLEPGRRVALVTMRISDSGVTLHSDASADLRWRTMLGGRMYVALDPGSPSAPPLGERTIPADRTDSQVEFDHLNQVYDRDTPHWQRTVLHELPTALSQGRAAAAIDALSPSLDTVAHGVEPMLGTQPDDLTRLVQATARTARALGADRRQLQGLVDGAAATLGTTAAHHAALGGAMQLTPPALDETIAAMRRVRTTLADLDPLVASLRPGVRVLPTAARTTRPALITADDLLRRARPLLRDLGPAMRSLGVASAAGRPLLRDLDPTVTRLRDELTPFLGYRDQDTGLRVYQAIGPTMSVLASAAGEFDGEGYWLHFPVEPGERTVAPLPCATFFTDPSAAEKVRCQSLNDVLGAMFNGRSGRR